MHEMHPVEKSPRYHVAIWILAGLIAAAVIFGVARQMDNPSAPSTPATEQEEK